jgi:hypothetical protein
MSLATERLSRYRSVVQISGAQNSFTASRLTQTHASADNLRFVKPGGESMRVLCHGGGSSRPNNVLNVSTKRWAAAHNSGSTCQTNCGQVVGMPLTVMSFA